MGRIGKIILSIFILHIRTIAHVRDLKDSSLIRDDCINLCASPPWYEWFEWLRGVWNRCASAFKCVLN